MKKILVTGGAGFIGAHTLVELIASGYLPIVVDDLSKSNLTLLRGVEQLTQSKLTFFQVDCNKVDDLRKIFRQHPDLSSVIHFAAYKSVSESEQQPLLYYRNNLGSLVSLLQVMKEFSVTKLIFSSSCTVYGQPDKIPVTELAPFQRAESAYGATKQMSERILEDEVKASADLRVVSLRYFNPIGAHPTGLIGELPIGVPTNLVPYVTQTAAGLRPTLTVFGGDYDTPDGSCLRDFIHVVDLAEAHVASLQKIDQLDNRYEVFNLGTGIPVSVLQLVKTFIEVSGVDLKYSVGPRRPGDIEKIYADPTKANKTLGWKTQLSIQDALRDAWNWQQKLSHATH
ncbi:MAG: UDP-glucose 4-epimerase GalE [Cyclobacteriaceae bacterium]|nr:UDP-glucose 4-epimerase GalE [Cyclobacteriaceae bacterium]